MGFAIVKAFLLVQLTVLLLSCITVFGEDIDALPPHPHGNYHHPPAEAPSHHHGRHHHQHTHPPSHAPVHPPSHAPIHPPSHAPIHPPSHAPAYPPPHHHHNGHPPSHHGHPPSHPPTHQAPPPSHIPVDPPMHHHAPPPSHPPVHPPPRGFPVPRSFVAVQGVVYCKSCKYAGVDNLSGASPVLGATVKLQCNNTKYPQVETAKTDKNGYFFITAPKTITTFGVHKCKVFLVSSPLASCSKVTDLHAGLKGSLLKPEKPFVSEKKLPFVLFTVGPFAFEPKCPL